jgi:hypothetical protein
MWLPMYVANAVETVYQRYKKMLGLLTYTKKGNSWTYFFIIFAFKAYRLPSKLLGRKTAHLLSYLFTVYCTSDGSSGAARTKGPEKKVFH